MQSYFSWKNGFKQDFFQNRGFGCSHRTKSIPDDEMMFGWNFWKFLERMFSGVDTMN